MNDGLVFTVSRKQARYEALLAGKNFNLKLNSAAKRRPQAQWTVLGSRSRRLIDRR